MRRVYILALLALLVFGLVACKSDEATSGSYGQGIVDDELYLVLVNKDNSVPSDWLDRVELAPAYNSLGESFMVERVTLANFEALRNELLEEGIDIELCGAYYSAEEQEKIWKYNSEIYGEEYCQKYVAPPGRSEHQTGLAVDVFLINQDGKVLYDTDAMTTNFNDFAKVHRLMSKYGFILRYPLGKGDVTGYDYLYEPWHLRFVGQQAAEVIYSRGITLEEYLANQ